jgi:hypothetical protein
LKKPVFWIRIAFLLLLLLVGRHVWLKGGEWLESAREFPWELNPPLLIISSLVLLVGLALSPEGWVMVCRQRGVTLGRRELYAVWFSSQLGRFIPGKVWLFAGRVALLKARGYTMARAASTLMLELLFSTAAVGIVAFGVSVFHPGITSSPAIRWSVTAAGVAVALLPLLNPLQRMVFRARGITFKPVPLKHSAKVTLFYTATWIIRGVALWAWFRGMGLNEAGLMRCLAAAPLSWLAAYIVVLVPGGLGVREAAAALIALPVEFLAPAVAAAGGQRIIMTIWEIALAMVTAGTLKRAGKEVNHEETQ